MSLRLIQTVTTVSKVYDSVKDNRERHIKLTFLGSVVTPTPPNKVGDVHYLLGLR